MCEALKSGLWPRIKKCRYLGLNIRRIDEQWYRL